jgi:hypothetical protein
MGTYEDIQNQTAEQTLREELQQVRKENEELASQVRALLAQLQNNQQYPTPPLGFSPRESGHEPGSTSSEPTPPPPPQPPRAAQVAHQCVMQPPVVQIPPVGTVASPAIPTTCTIQPTATDKQSAEQMEYILSKLRVLEGSHGTIDPSQYCIVTDIEIPKDFKVPDFEKYKGTTDPLTHLQMYCSKMGAYLKNEKMMLYYFQESLTNPAIKWYLNLDKKEIRTWNDLANAFLKQYKHNTDFAPDKSSLKKLIMHRNEDFRTFALRWRNEAAQIEPPMTEKELVDAFIDLECLNSQYKYSCANAIDFAHLLRTGVRIESALRSADNDKRAGKKKEDVVHHIAAASSSTAQFTQSPYKPANRSAFQA